MLTVDDDEFYFRARHIILITQKPRILIRIWNIYGRVLRHSWWYTKCLGKNLASINFRMLHMIRQVGGFYNFVLTYIRAVPLKNPRGGEPPPLKFDPTAPGFSKFFDPPAPRFAKSIGPPPPPDSLLSLRPPTPRFLGLFGLKTVLF